MSCYIVTFASLIKITSEECIHAESLGGSAVQLVRKQAEKLHPRQQKPNGDTLHRTETGPGLE